MMTRLALLLASLVAGALVNLRAGDTIHTRGWIGGDYAVAKRTGVFESSRAVPAFPSELRAEYKAGIFARSVPPHSPAATAGLQAGDLILRVGGQNVERLPKFHKLVELTQPGHPLQLTVWRQGEVRTLRVDTGRETYRNVGTLGLGIHLSSKLDLWPNPVFSLIALGYDRLGERLELHSTESAYVRDVRQRNGAGADSAQGSREGWKVWLVILQLGMHKHVLSQEQATAPGAPDSSPAPAAAQ
jgi:hypothetical protein